MSALRPPAGAICLDGTWSFRYWTGDDPGDHFWLPTADRSSFTTIDVPGSWMLQGGTDHRFGIPIYTNVQYPFPVADYPHVPLADEAGDHVTEVLVPEEWLDRRIVLRIGAAESWCAVWVDGHEVGTSTDSRLPVEFDVTDVVTPGAATTIAIRVQRWGAATWVEDQDMWWMAGLHRSIHLYSTPTERIADVAFETLAVGDDEAATEARIDLAGVAGVRRVDVALTPLDEASPSVVAGADVSGDGVVTVPLAVSEPRLWSAETPDRYRLGVTLSDAAGARLDHCELLVGIRTVEVANGCLLVNGRPVTLFGVNRHEHDGQTGRWQTDALLEADSPRTTSPAVR